MNMVLLPIIRRLFPNAPIILAIRHPCDTVLSCFLQHFRSDLALLGGDLTALARSYSRAFGFWYSQSVLAATRHTRAEIRTARRGLRGRGRQALRISELARHEAMFAPGEHARGKGFISTPSYAQVLEPVSNRSVGRWKHYERHFSSEVLALLMPWIERRGYYSARFDRSSGSRPRCRFGPA